MLDLNRLIWAPSVAMVANTVFLNSGLEDAVEISDAVDAAETPGSPLNELLFRAYNEGEQYGGNGDDLAEFGGRQCYRSWEKGRDNQGYIDNIKQMGHGSVFEHASIVFQVTGVSRSLTHELVRHRAGTAYSQESQRYVPAKNINFVVPPLLANFVAKETGGDPRFASVDQLDAIKELTFFRNACQSALDNYTEFLPILVDCARLFESATPEDVKAATSALKRANEAARSLLPNAAETRLLFTTNLRSLMHILCLRGTEFADLEIRRFTVAVIGEARSYAPNFFRDLTTVVGSDKIEALVSETGRV